MAARPVHAILPSILVVVLLFHFQVADSSRPLSTEERQKRTVVHRASAEAHHHRDTAETGTGRVAVEMTSEVDDGSRTTTTTRAEEGDTAAPMSATTTTTSARGKHDDDGIGSRKGKAPTAVVQTTMLLRSRLARRFLAGEVEGADSAAKPSCHSSDVHNGCNPPSEH